LVFEGGQSVLICAEDRTDIFGSWAEMANVASTRPQAQLTPPEARGRLIAFAVSLRAGGVHLVEERG
jgi:hypothetical protein